jgi:predicted HTH domain antitoxin
MLISIPDEAIADQDLSASDLLMALAVALYQNGRLTMGHACKMTNLSDIEFQRLLADRGVDIRYPPESLDDDLATLRSVFGPG